MFVSFNLFPIIHSCALEPSWIDPLLHCLTISKEQFAATLYSLFQNMANDRSYIKILS